MAFSLERAMDLIGKSRSEYVCNQVANKVLNDDKNKGGSAASYSTWGRQIEVPVAGAVVVSKNGSHMGIFISPTEFIHSSLQLNRVQKCHKSKLPYVFGKDYQIRVKP
jgi:hypothetical protein